MIEKILNIIKHKVSNQVLLSLSLLLFLFKLAVDLLMYLFTENDSFFSISLRIIISISVITPLAFYFFRNFFNKLNNAAEIGFNSFNEEIKSINFLLLFVILGKLLIPNSLEFHGRINNILGLLYVNIYAIICLVAGFKLLHFLFKWLWIKRHKKTKSQLMLIRLAIYFFLIAEMPLIYFNRTLTDFTSNPIISIPIAFIHIFLFVTMFLSASKNNWIALLSKREKFLLILQSIIILTLTIIIDTFMWELNGEGKFYYGLGLFYGSSTILTLPVVLSAGYIIRIMFSAIVSLPTTEIVGKKSNELKLLTYLNKIISQSIDFNKLIDTATSIAYESINASGAWTELYNDNNEINIISDQNINKEYLETLHKNPVFTEIFKEIDDFLLIESVIDSQEENKIIGLIDFASALIAIPLKDGNKRIGTLVVTNVDEYGFDTEDLNIIQAIGNNVNIALENAKLITESLEKEQYKKEMMIAHSITEKLIPINLCCIDYYDIASYILPAEEVGGDYYDLVTLRDGKNCLLIGDISGKGISAAFYMALLKGVVISTVNTVDSPKDLLVKINQALYSNMDKQMYLTLSAIKIEDNEGNITFSRAGHLPMILKSGLDTKLYTPKGIGIGLAKTEFFEKHLEEISIKLDYEDYCLLFTDGVSDALDGDSEDLDYEKMKHILTNSVYNNTSELVNIMEYSLKNSKKFKNQRDDMTLLAIRYNKLGVI